MEERREAERGGARGLEAGLECGGGAGVREICGGGAVVREYVEEGLVRCGGVGVLQRRDMT